MIIKVVRSVGVHKTMNFTLNSGLRCAGIMLLG